MNNLFLDAITWKTIHRPPVWIMRQAGRYLPSYQNIRKKYSLKEIFTNTDLITEVTLLPIQDIDPDAAILFSDILIIALSMGFELDFIDGVGPITRPLVEPKDIEKLSFRPIDETLPFIKSAIQNLKKDLKVPLIGFAGAPFTVSTYILGKDRFKTWMYQEKEIYLTFLDKICDLTIEYLLYQIENGAQAVQIFDSWVNLLSYEQFSLFSLPFLKRIREKIKNVPVIIFMRGSCYHLDDLLTISPSAISFDWTYSLKELVKRTQKKVVLQGNFDPDILYFEKDMIKTIVQKELRALDTFNGIICNLGHGIKPDMTLGHVKHFVDTIKEISYVRY